MIALRVLEIEMASKSTLTSVYIRQMFIDFFTARDHVFVPSSPVLLPPNEHDNSLGDLFVNSGIIQFKPYLIGQRTNPWKRVVNTQKCIRLGGKHGDLDSIGDNFHHTFFEMLGNWSFNDYSKKEACKFAWEFLTNVLGIDKRRLYITYFNGEMKQKNNALPKFNDSFEPLAADLETRDIWLQLVPDDHVIGCPAEHNLWDMGSQIGPCGPCSEIHVDMVKGRSESGASMYQLINKSEPTLLELWNIVFMEKQRLPDGSFKDLSSKNIDCGMGFERLVSLMQESSSAYDTDLFVPIIHSIGDLINESGKAGQTLRRIYMAEGRSNIERKDKNIAIRIVADHIRAVTVALADGVEFSNRNQGREIRRLLRRAIYFAYWDLGIDPRRLAELVPSVVGTLSDFYPELKAKESYCQDEVHSQETRFWRKLEKLGKRFQRLFDKKSMNKISGEVAFQLYRDGLPIEWLQALASKHNIEIDESSFKDLHNKWQQQQDTKK